MVESTLHQEPHITFCVLPFTHPYPPTPLHSSSTRTVSVFFLFFFFSFSLSTLPHFSPVFSTIHILSHVSKKNNLPKFIALSDRYLKKKCKFIDIFFLVHNFRQNFCRTWYSCYRYYRRTVTGKLVCVKISLLLRKVRRKPQITQLLRLAPSTPCMLLMQCVDITSSNFYFWGQNAFLKFNVLTLVNVKTAVFCHVAPCSLVDS